jgi:hypothetical protein
MTSTISLTELRQRLFQLADQVIESGEPLVIERHGVRLRLIREDTATNEGGRLARLVQQDVVIGAPLAPHESPSTWNADLLSKVAEPGAPGWRKATRSTRPRNR